MHEGSEWEDIRGNGIIAAFTTSGNGILLLLNNDLLFPPMLKSFDVSTGVEGGVIGNLDRFPALAPSRCRGVSFDLVVNIGLDFGAETVGLMASGMREGLVMLDAGVS